MAAYKMHLYDVVSIEETSFEYKKRDTPMGDQVTQETAASLELDDTSTNSESQANNLFSTRDDAITDADLIGAAVESNSKIDENLVAYNNLVNQVEELRTERNELEQRIDTLPNDELRQALTDITRLGREIDSLNEKITNMRSEVRRLREGNKTAKETERKGKGKIPEGKSVSTRGKTVSLSQATNLS